jgi:hypothetical protein
VHPYGHAKQTTRIFDSHDWIERAHKTRKYAWGRRSYRGAPNAEAKRRSRRRFKRLARRASRQLIQEKNS